MLRRSYVEHKVWKSIMINSKVPIQIKSYLPQFLAAVHGPIIQEQLVASGRQCLFNSFIDSFCHHKIANKLPTMHRKSKIVEILDELREPFPEAFAKNFIDILAPRTRRRCREYRSKCCEFIFLASCWQQVILYLQDDLLHD
jgi:hypothetical protein